MSEFVTVANVGDIPVGEGRSYPVNGRMVGVFHVDDTYYAIDDACPHMGASLASGYVEDGAVTCPWHAWRFCVRDGSWLDSPRSSLNAASYEVRIEGDEIQVRLPAAPAAENSDESSV